MTRIRARCPGCGDVEFGVDDIVVIGGARLPSTYRFDCPGCGEAISRSAVPQVIDLLLSAGVRRSSTPVRASAPSGARPFAEDDVAALREALADPEWFARLEASVPRD